VVFSGTESGDGCSWICARVGDLGFTGCRIGLYCGFAVARAFFARAIQSREVYGLTDALAGDGPIRQYAQRLSRPNLYLVSSGGESDSSQELLTSGRMRTRIAELHTEFNYVLMDVAPFNTCNHAMVLAHSRTVWLWS